MGLSDLHLGDQSRSRMEEIGTFVLSASSIWVAFYDDCPKEHLPLNRTCGLQWNGAHLCCGAARSKQGNARKIT